MTVCIRGVLDSSEESGKQYRVGVQRGVAVVIVELKPLNKCAVEKGGGTWSETL